MSTDLTQPGRRKQRRKMGRKMGRVVLFAAAVTTMLAGGAGIAYAIGWGLAEPPPATAASVETQMECTEIKREYDSWLVEGLKLPTLASLDREEVSYQLQQMFDAGKSFDRAASNRTDQPAKELALAVSEYNAAVGFLRLNSINKPVLDLSLHSSALAADRKVTAAYEHFLVTTCG